MKKKKCKIIAGGMTGVILVCGVFYVPNISKAGNNEEQVVEKTFQQGNYENRKQTSSVTGTIEKGTNYEYLSYTVDMEHLLEVEEIFVESGETITTGGAILKVTEDSFQAVKEYLEKEEKQAKRSYEEEKIAYKMDLLELKAEYASQISTGDLAEEGYDNTIEMLEQQVELAEEEYKETLEIINKYPAKIKTEQSSITKKEDTLKKLKKQLKTVEKEEEKAKKEYDSAKKTYEELKKQKEEIEIVKKYLMMYQASIDNSEKKDVVEKENIIADKNQTEVKNVEDSNYESSMKENIQNTSEWQSYVQQVDKDEKAIEKAYQSAEKKYKDTLSKYEVKNKALEEKEEAIEEKEEEIDSLKSTIKKEQEELANAKKQVSEKKLNSEQAISNLEQKSVSAKKELEESKLTREGASSTYQLALKELKETLKEAKDVYKKAKENLENFEEDFKDTIWYAKQEGLLNYIGYKEGKYLTGMNPIVGYVNEEEVSVEITVDQSEVAALSVGDTVTVRTSSSPRGMMGIVSKIANEKNSTSASKVTYAVVISIQNQQKSLESGETVTVLFVNKGEKEDEE